MAHKRTDAERRARQCERLSRMLRVLQLIMGPGRWDAEGLARELECSPWTIHRILQTLSMSGVPWHYDEAKRAYRVRPGYRFSDDDSLHSRRCEGTGPGNSIPPLVAFWQHFKRPK
jgi:hypothetical protein